MLRNFIGCIVALVLSLLAITIEVDAKAYAGDSLAPHEMFEEGRRLEGDRRWQEAIQLYEKLLRKEPQNADIDRRLQIVRIHYDVSRRYSDKSFIDLIGKTQPKAAFDVMSEILTKLQLYYVDSLDYPKLMRNGTAFLEVALTEPEFLATNIGRQVAPQSIENFRLNVHKLVLGRPVAGPQEVSALISQVATAARDQIGLATTPIIYEYISGFVGLLDPYSAFLTGDEYREIMSQIEGNLIGIGVELWADRDDLKIVEVFKGAPSEQAGLLKGDRLMEIGGVRVSDIGAKRAADLLRGPENSTVSIVCERSNNGRFECQVTRRRVDVPSVSSASIVDAESGIAYIRISNFQRTTTNEVDDALRSLHGSGMQSLIIDLRRNPGGLLDAAVEIADRFLASGFIVSTRGRNGQENRNYTAHTPGTWEVPLVVMIDEDSASASEIFAGAIRDQNRGLVVGETSYGKGSVQGVFQNELSDGGVRLTISKFFSPAGHAISSRGIIPHVTFSELKNQFARVNAKPVLSQVGVGQPVASLKPNIDRDQSFGDAFDHQAEEGELRNVIDMVRAQFPKLSGLR